MRIKKIMPIDMIPLDLSGVDFFVMSIYYKPWR